MFGIFENVLTFRMGKYTAKIDFQILYVLVQKENIEVISHHTNIYEQNTIINVINSSVRAMAKQEKSFKGPDSTALLLAEHHPNVNVWTSLARLVPSFSRGTFGLIKTILGQLVCKQSKASRTSLTFTIWPPFNCLIIASQ